MLIFKHRAFTLLELIIIVVIILILTGISLPNFYKAKERALQKEAIANLKLIGSAEKIYKMESNDNIYVDCACSNATECNNPPPGGTGCNVLLKLSLNTENWTYGVVAVPGPPSTFIATATRVSGTSCEYKLNQDTTGDPIGTDCL